MLIPAPIPNVSMAEPEIALADLAKAYGKAIGEPVEPMPTVRDRTVAIFVKNEPWDRVLALAGEVAGFRIARKDGRLRFESTRRFDLETMQAELTRRLRRYANLPDDLAKARARADVVKKALETSRRQKPADPTRLAELTRESETLENVESPGRLLLARYLKRGGIVPLGKTVLLRFHDYVSDQEFALYDHNGTTPPAPRFAALRCEDATLEVALEGERNIDLWRTWSTQIEVDPTAPASKEARLALGKIEWTRVPPPEPRAFAVYRIGDVLGWIHRATDRPAVGAAPRIALPRLDENLTYALLNGPVRFGVRGEAFVATTAFGDGLWPKDLRRLEELKNPTLTEIAAVCADASPVWEALHAREYGEIASRFHVTLNSSLPILRMIGRASSGFLARLRNEDRIIVDSLDAGSKAALERMLIEDASPARAIEVAMARAMTISPRWTEEDATIFSTDAGMETGIHAATIRQYPQAVQGLPAEFRFEAPARVESLTITAGEGERIVGAGVSFAHAIGAKTERKR